MNTLLKDLFISLRGIVLFAVILCGIYPATIWILAQLVAPHQANGSLLVGTGRKVVGSELLGQNFTAPHYFHPRPSAAGASGYDGLASGGSNLGPTSRTLITTVQQRATLYRAENGLAKDTLVPVDAVTSSGSGLDPHISPKNALLQTPRVAQARGIDLEVVKEAVELATHGAQWGLFGEPCVNVLELNLALDRTKLER